MVCGALRHAAGSTWSKQRMLRICWCPNFVQSHVEVENGGAYRDRVYSIHWQCHISSMKRILRTTGFYARLALYPSSKHRDEGAVKKATGMTRKARTVRRLMVSDLRGHRWCADCLTALSGPKYCRLETLSETAMGHIGSRGLLQGRIRAPNPTCSSGFPSETNQAQRHGRIYVGQQHR